jgi:hypothetical protein
MTVSRAHPALLESVLRVDRAPTRDRFDTGAALRGESNDGTVASMIWRTVIRGEPLTARQRAVLAVSASRVVPRGDRLGQ